MVGLMKEHGQPLRNPESEPSPKFCTLAGGSTPHAPCTSDALDTGILRTDSGCPQGGAMPWEGVGGTSIMCGVASNRGHHFNKS